MHCCKGCQDQILSATWLECTNCAWWLFFMLRVAAPTVRCKNIGSLTLEYIFGISFRKCFFEIESMLTSRGTISGQHLGAGIEWTWIVVMVYPCDSSKCAPLMLCLEQVLANTSLCTSHLEYICKMPSFGCPKGATLEA